MAHQIYLTEGIILKKKDFWGGGQACFAIYTEKFGMISERPQRGVRLEKLKLGNLDVFIFVANMLLFLLKIFGDRVDAGHSSPSLNHTVPNAAVWRIAKVFAMGGQSTTRNDKRRREKRRNLEPFKNLFSNLFKENISKMEKIIIKSLAAIFRPAIWKKHRAATV